MTRPSDDWADSPGGMRAEADILHSASYDNLGEQRARPSCPYNKQLVQRTADADIEQLRVVLRRRIVPLVDVDYDSGARVARTRPAKVFEKSDLSIYGAQRAL
jgi:hypothetical protein